MKMRDQRTGDVVEVPPPDQLGNGVVLFNGVVVERCVYRDPDTTTCNGRVYRGTEWATYIVKQLEAGAWRAQA